MNKKRDQNATTNANVNHHHDFKLKERKVYATKENKTWLQHTTIHAFCYKNTIKPLTKGKNHGTQPVHPQASQFDKK